MSETTSPVFGSVVAIGIGILMMMMLIAVLFA